MIDGWGSVVALTLRELFERVDDGVVLCCCC